MPSFDRSLTNLSDAELLNRWKAGEQDSADIILDRYALRLAALVAGRIGQRYRSSIDAEDLTQSALGSFFAAVDQSRFKWDANLTLWKVLATFARRKLSRAIERESAIKRGGEARRTTLDHASDHKALEEYQHSSEAQDELIEDICSKLTPAQQALLEHLLAGRPQDEIATITGLHPRSLRRRIRELRERLGQESALGTEEEASSFSSSVLPQIQYREFVLGKWLGAGGFAKVYRARMQADDSVVAVKFLRKSLWKSQAARLSFLREIELAAQLKHPNIIRYLGWGETVRAAPYVVAEWIDGESFANQVSSTQRSVHQLRKVLLQLCDALQCVHQAGMIHGDITPSNILVDSSWRPVLIDFGLSRLVSDLARPQDLPAAGTLGFLAPEQLSTHFGELSPATDVFAVGALIHWYYLGIAPNLECDFTDSIRRTLSSFELRGNPIIDFESKHERAMHACLRVAPNERPSIVDMMNMLV